MLFPQEPGSLTYSISLCSQYPCFKETSPITLFKMTYPTNRSYLSLQLHPFFHKTDYHLTHRAIHLSLAHFYYFKFQENVDYHFCLLLYLHFLEQHWIQSRCSKNTGCLDNLCWSFLTKRLQVSKNWLKNKMSLEYLEEAFTRFSEGLGRPLSCRGTEQRCLG